MKSFVFFTFLVVVINLTNATAITYGEKLDSTPDYIATVWGKSNDGLLAEPICSGVLVADNKLLTAAHCVFNKDVLFISFPNDPSEYKVEYKINHSNYNSDSKLFDISVLKLTESLNKKIITLPPKNDKPLLMISNLFVIGNGLNENNESDGEYRFAFQSDLSYDGGKYYTEFIENNMIAAGRYLPDRQLFSKACPGDSGSPLIASFGGIETLLGLVSFGADDCTIPAPSVYVRISSYIDFIEQAIEA